MMNKIGKQKRLCRCFSFFLHAHAEDGCEERLNEWEGGGREGGWGETGETERERGDRGKR